MHVTGPDDGVERANCDARMILITIYGSKRERLAAIRSFTSSFAVANRGIIIPTIARVCHGTASTQTQNISQHTPVKCNT